MSLLSSFSGDRKMSREQPLRPFYWTSISFYASKKKNLCSPFFSFGREAENWSQKTRAMHFWTFFSAQKTEEVNAPDAKQGRREGQSSGQLLLGG